MRGIAHFPMIHCLSGGALLFLLVALPGCIPNGPKAPDGWTSRTVEKPATLLDDHDRHSSLFQLLVGYRRVLGHSALRIIGPGDSKLFWDPGGGYREFDHINRVDDVIVGEDVPDIMTYAEHRFTEIPMLESEFVVMEWNIKDSSALTMRQVLIDGWSPAETGGTEPPEKFDSDAMTFWCATTMSQFLKDHGQGEIGVSKIYAYPHDILYEVWRKYPPIRVIAFKRDRTAILFEPVRKSPASDAK